MYVRFHYNFKPSRFQNKGFWKFEKYRVLLPAFKHSDLQALFVLELVQGARCKGSQSSSETTALATKLSPMNQLIL